MRILWGNHVKLAKIAKSNGFGYATERIVASLERLGHVVGDDIDNADVEVWFDQPHWIRWRSETAYRICYVPWESTELPEGWLEKMNSANEVWTPSQTIADWFVAAGVNVPVHVYLHGVDKIWSPVERSLEGDFNVFHHGGEACRKGWLEAVTMYRDNFLDKNANMNFKMLFPGWNVPVPHVNIYSERWDIEDLVRLYHKQHLMVYPSWGEGFGLTPLQAMATNMPVLISGGWAPYEKFLPPECIIDTTLVESPWPDVHPGKMLKPDVRDMANKALNIYENYDHYKEIFRDIGWETRFFYDWDNLTNDMFLRLEKRLKLVAS